LLVEPRRPAGHAHSDLSELFRDRRTPLIATVTAITGDADAAADAVDEAFVRAFERAERVQAMDAPASWILTVALNVVRRSKVRSRRRHLAEASAAPADWIAPADPRHELWIAVQALPPRERVAVALRYLADLTEPQIAEVMGIAVGTVGASLTSARRRLAERLHHPEEEAPT
jgi:RNA polymerase sigma factor (sigma-70 family)